MKDTSGIDELCVQRLVAAVELVTGNRVQAKEWLSKPLATFDGRSAMELLAEGRLDDIMKYLSSIESGFVG